MGELDYADPSRPKSPAIPMFYTEPVHMEFLSKQLGKPRYEDRDFVKIIIPGDRRSMVVEPVNEDHKARWPKEYEAFKAGKELPLEGTPLANWPNSAITRSRVEELAYFNIRTVEQMADVTDAHLQNLGMGAYELRAVARKFLETARTGTAPLERLVNENITLRDENARLTRELTEARARADILEQELRHARTAT